MSTIISMSMQHERCAGTQGITSQTHINISSLIYPYIFKAKCPIITIAELIVMIGQI